MVSSLYKQAFFNGLYKFGFTKRSLVAPGTIFYLTYHSVCEPIKVPTQELGISVSPRMFEQHMRYIKRFLSPVSLPHAEEMLRGQRQPVRGAVVVTFDDGYRDNLTHALPIIERYEIPVTIFLIVGLIGTPTRPWNIELYFDLFSSEVKRLVLAPRDKEGEVLIPISSLIDKKFAVCLLRRYLKIIDMRARDSVLSDIRAQLRAKSVEKDDQLLTMLNWKDVSELRKRGITFGSHTMSHSILQNECQEVVTYEVMESKNLLEEKLGEKVTAFAYPGNSGKGFNVATKELVKKAGYSSCYLFSTGTGFNHEGCDMYSLNRGEVVGPVWDLAAEVTGARDFMRRMLARWRPIPPWS